ncbi:hypothetical protein NEFER03_0230 [Nematocida sp. LUAm3]|nr:hypothetical protein NEFER03_0230 [Nematocida sp. LUAm3]KAI5173683.1 hypothetical protein NEFER02_0199 [Nematocida sp. LUAm2]KAI5176904.1 hypothetical protein NEFER01_0229 [Nematocida sp. LUAm1]
MHPLFASIRSFNTCLYTEVGTPLPLSDEEKLFYSADSIKFYIKIGSENMFDSTRYYSSYGSIFVTSFRLMYIPSSPQPSFCSFSVSCLNVLDVSYVGTDRVELIISYPHSLNGKLKLGFRKNLPDTFIQQLQMAISNMQAHV